ncbi:unnamed protein product, partial [Tuber aestivum]
MSTLALYQGFLEEGGYPGKFSYSDPRHRGAYLYLHNRVSDYITLGHKVQLSLQPVGASKWIAAHQSHEIEV